MSIRPLLSLSLLALIFPACGGGGSDAPPASPTQQPQPESSPQTSSADQAAAAELAGVWALQATWQRGNCGVRYQMGDELNFLVEFSAKPGTNEIQVRDLTGDATHARSVIADLAAHSAPALVTDGRLEVKGTDTDLVLDLGDDQTLAHGEFVVRVMREDGSPGCNDLFDVVAKRVAADDVENEILAWTMAGVWSIDLTIVESSDPMLVGETGESVFLLNRDTATGNMQFRFEESPTRHHSGEFDGDFLTVDAATEYEDTLIQISYDESSDTLMGRARVYSMDDGVLSEIEFSGGRPSHYRSGFRPNWDLRILGIGDDDTEIALVANLERGVLDFVGGGVHLAGAVSESGTYVGYGVAPGLGQFEFELPISPVRDINGTWSANGMSGQLRLHSTDQG